MVLFLIIYICIRDGYKCIKKEQVEFLEETRKVALTELIKENKNKNS